jgi:hypothetical protein
MRIVANNCPNCGASISFDADKRLFTCEYCNTESQIQHRNGSESLVKIEIHDHQGEAKNLIKLTAVIFSVAVIFGAVVLILTNNRSSDSSESDIALAKPATVSIAVTKAKSTEANNNKEDDTPKSEFDKAIESAFAEFVLEDYEDASDLSDLESGTLVKVSGTVMQVVPINRINTTVLGDSTALYLIAVDDDNENIILVEHSRKTEAEKISMYDTVVLYGVVYDTIDFSRSVGSVPMKTPHIIAVVIEKHNTSSFISYEDKPFTSSVTYSPHSGAHTVTAVIDGFKITGSEAHGNQMKLSYEVSGMVKGGTSLRLSMNYYDEDGSVIGKGSIDHLVSQGVQFKINGEHSVPIETVRIDFDRD